MVIAAVKADLELNASFFYSGNNSLNLVNCKVNGLLTEDMFAGFCSLNCNVCVSIC